MVRMATSIRSHWTIFIEFFITLCTFESGSESLYHILINFLKFIHLVINKHLIGDKEDFRVV